MSNRLVIALALGVLVAVLGAGAVSAQVNVNGNGVTVDVPGVGEVGTEGVLACANGADDDGDGLQDMADPGCYGPADGDETDTAAADHPDDADDPDDSDDPDRLRRRRAIRPTRSEPDRRSEPEEPTESGESKGGGGDARSPRTATTPSVDDKKGDKKDKDEQPSRIPTPTTRTTASPSRSRPIRRPDGAPTNSNPSVTITDFGAAPIGVPNFVIDQFSIPPFLLPIYQACGTQYNVPWEVLASINRIETAFGTNLNVSTAGALGWMQFIPSSWEMYGTDANGDGRKDPYNPVDAICAAARYLKAAGAEEDLYTAIFAYNHADWYVDEVLLYAKQYGNLPSGLVDSLTGLTEGAHFPVAAKARYADDISERAAIKRATPKQGVAGNAADVISDSPTRRGIDIFSEENAPVVAANDGVITKIGVDKELGKYIVLRDAYGNEFTYAGLGEVSDVIPVPKRAAS